MSIYSFLFILLSLSSCLAWPRKPLSINPNYKVTVAPYTSTLSTSPQMTQHKLASRYLQTTSRRITLDDGRTLQCKIPLIDGFGSEEPLNDTANVTEARNLTKEEYSALLVQLTDKCTHYRTVDFLWEFCHEKYLRQFDDEMTRMNSNKPSKELFFLGFHKSVDPLKYARLIDINTGAYQPERSFDIPLMAEVSNERYLYTHGRIARIVNMRSFHRDNSETLYFVRAYILAKELNDSAIVGLDGKTLKDYRKAKKESKILKIIEGEKYVKVERFIIKVLNMYTAWLDREFPLDIATSHAKIFPYTGKIDKKMLFNMTRVETITSQIVLFGPYLYGHKAFLSTAEPFSSVLMITNKSEVITKVITEIIDDSTIKLNHDLGLHKEIHPHTLVLIGGKGELKDIMLKQGKGRIWSMGNILLGKGTAFKKNFVRGDLVMLLEGRNMTWAEQTVEVLEVVHDTLMIVRNPKSDSYVLKNATSLYMIGKYVDLKQYGKKFAADRRRIVDKSVNNVNSETLNSLLLIRTGKKIVENEPFCHSSFYFPDSRAWLMTFEPRLINRNANLMLHFSNTSCNTDQGVEVNFNNMEELIVVDSADRSNILRVPIIKNPQLKIKAYRGIMWILFDRDTLTIGEGEHISLEKQIISLKLASGTELSHYTINQQFSYNLELANIQVRKFAPAVQQTVDIMRNVSSVTGNVTYFETYGQGTYCEASKFERRTDIEYKCSKTNSFFEIEKVREDATCHYRVTIGTNLLCPGKKHEKPSQKPYNIDCILEEDKDFLVGPN